METTVRVADLARECDAALAEGHLVLLASKLKSLRAALAFAAGENDDAEELTELADWIDAELHDGATERFDHLRLASQIVAGHFQVQGEGDGVTVVAVDAYPCEWRA